MSGMGGLDRGGGGVGGGWGRGGGGGEGERESRGGGSRGHTGRNSLMGKELGETQQSAVYTI